MRLSHRQRLASKYSCCATIAKCCSRTGGRARSSAKWRSSIPVRAPRRRASSPIANSSSSPPTRSLIASPSTDPVLRMCLGVVIARYREMIGMIDSRDRRQVPRDAAATPDAISRRRSATLSLEGELAARAPATGEFELFFQPIVRLPTRVSPDSRRCCDGAIRARADPARRLHSDRGGERADRRHHGLGPRRGRSHVSRNPGGGAAQRRAGRAIVHVVQCFRSRSLATPRSSNRWRRCWRRPASRPATSRSK